MKNVMKFQIGDWSNDGHGKCDTFMVTANKSTDDVREAYFRALKKFPKCMSPEEFMCEYGDQSLPKKTYEAALEHGYDLLKGFKEDEGRAERLPDEKFEDWLDYPQIDTDEMLNYLLWFTMQGDPELKLKAESEHEDNTFAFYGADKKGRHIGFIGYGLFGD